jgi:hypothetical protein
VVRLSRDPIADISNHATLLLHSLQDKANPTRRGARYTNEEPSSSRQDFQSSSRQDFESSASAPATATPGHTHSARRSGYGTPKQHAAGDDSAHAPRSSRGGAGGGAGGGTPEGAAARGIRAWFPGILRARTRFACFASTKVHMLTRAGLAGGLQSSSAPRGPPRDPRAQPGRRRA